MVALSLQQWRSVWMNNSKKESSVKSRKDQKGIGEGWCITNG